MVSPMPALLIGLLVMSSAGVSSAVWLQNVAAGALGLPLAAWVYLRRRNEPTLHAHLPKVWVALSLILLALTLLHPGTEGVRRWLPVGPLNVHAGALVIPLLLVSVGLLELRWSAGVALMGAVLTFLQPDAAQAAGLALGWTVLALRMHGRSAVGPSVALMVVAIATLLRPDPLEPVAHVEGVVGMAAELGPLWSVGGLVALVLPPLVLFTRPPRASASALGAYLGAVLVAAWIGHFPVPFMGHGVAPILGYYVAIGALGYYRAPDSPAQATGA